MNWVRDWHDEPAPGTGTAVMWTPVGPVIVGASPLRVACPVTSCQAAIGEHCTRLVPRKGRVRCATHQPRIDLAAQAVEGDTGPLATAS